MKQRILLITILLAPLGLLSSCSTSGETAVDAQASRVDQVRDAGAEVMPFDLDKTKHSFTTNDDGGVQTVFTLDPDDTEQLKLVRNHLSYIATEFQRGNFTDPADIHGSDMPGLGVLKTNPDRFSITYEKIATGGKLTYRSAEPEIVQAIHDWFEAQISDHGSDAVTHVPSTGMSAELMCAHHPETCAPSILKSAE